MRTVRKALLLPVAVLVAAGLLATTAGATTGPVLPTVTAPASTVWVQPPAWIPIAAEVPELPPFVGAAHLWVPAAGVDSDRSVIR